MRFQTLLLLAASGGATAASPPTRPTVTVSSGVIHGVSTNLPKKGATVNKFLGVPYAAPPARFERPTFPEPWKKPFKATKFGPACLQNFGLNEIAPRVEVLQELFNTPKPPESEDCLSINIFAPVATLAKAPRAVLVFIPGGGFQLGSGRSDLSAFAAYEDIIAVSFNYRTNVFGFPSSQDIPITERNLGLYDQRLALEWIQQNIASFGGDPSKVTIWGESAGAFSVDFHLKAYANDLPLPFRAAIPSSGQTSFGFAALTPNPRDDSGWLALAEAVGCKTGSDLLKCMKKASSKKLVDAMFKQKISFSPQLDGVTVLGKPAELWRTGQVARVPILTGTIWEEGRALVNDKVNLTTFLAVYLPFPPIYKETTDAIVAVYRSDPRLKTDFDIAAAILTDFFWACVRPSPYLLFRSRIREPKRAN
ncbi:para-nitrobenzyl esterase [Colletotrichum truncatum]|uniref:Para-nitrobenzyl esterase n=1 Tax=Colletotrichum truncatum TaxID=5467 RepID=A0ACC3ZGD7_COLTU|nr:para-nitrobenzyl esterase [Colletotrichum truncatum]KAF6784652.1 para-nitrobenzyl esterase [Colletotrichum truncatum]